MDRIRSLKLRWLHGQLTELSWENITGISSPHPATWQPAINVFRCESAYCICVDLAGVAKDEIELLVEPGRLLIRGSRTPPHPTAEHGRAVRVLAMEIDAGRFQRELHLPPEVDLDRISAEQENGLLWIRLPIP